jgi:hypothetical protein
MTDSRRANPRRSSAVRAAILAPVVLLLAITSAPPARPGVIDDFNRARNAFTFGNYGEAIRVLTGLLQPLQLRDEGQLVEARQLLGVCHYFTRNYFAAQEEFERLLYVRPRHELDPLLFPPPVIEFFEKVRARIKDKLARLHPERKPPAPERTLIVRRVERRPWALNLFPFGVGQLMNGQTKKGIFFLASELAMLTTNLVTYAVAESRRLPDGRFNAADESSVRGLRVAQIVSLATLGALVVGGIVDAFVEWQPEVVTEERTPLPAPPATPPAPPREGAPKPASPGAGPRSSRGFGLFPWASASGAGLAFGFRF